MNDILVWIGQQISQHIWMIAMAMASALMVLAGQRLSRVLRGFLHGYPWIVRTSAFVMMCAVGYGALTVAIGHGLNHLLRDLSPEVLALVVPGVFIALGVIAERRGEL